MIDEVKKFAEFSESVATATQECLSAWNFEKNYQFPTLIADAAAKIGVEPAIIDPLVRRYVNMSERYKSCRGVKGGVTLKAEWLKKQQAKEDAKKQVEQEIAAKLAASSQPVIEETSETESSLIEESSEVLTEGLIES